MAIKNQLDPYGAALNASLTDAAGRTIDISSPTWYEDFRLARQAKNAERAAAPLPSQVAEAEKKVVGPYKEGIDPNDPLHAPNYFAADKIAALTASERKDHYDTWMRQHSRNYLTPQGDLDFRASARVKENNIFGLVPQATFGEGVKDTAISAYSGLVSGAKSLTDIAGTDNWVSQQLGQTLDILDANKSQEKKVAEVAHSRKIENAKGAWDTSKAVLSKLAEDPVDTLAGAVGSSIPYLAPSTLAVRVGAGAKTLLATLAGTGAVGGVGSEKGAIEEQVKQAAIAQGKSPAEAQVLATNAQNYSSDNAVRLAAAALIGGAGSLLGLDNAILRAAGSPAAIGKAVVNKIAPSTTAKALASGTGEALTEATQSATETEAANNASIKLGLMKESERWSGVGEAALEGGIVGFTAGAGFGAVEGARNAKPTADTTTPTQAPTPPATLAAREKAIADLTKAMQSGDTEAIEAARVAAETDGILEWTEIIAINHGLPVAVEPTPKSPAYLAAEAELKIPDFPITDQHTQDDINSEFRTAQEEALVRVDDSGVLTPEELVGLEKRAKLMTPPSKEAYFEALDGKTSPEASDQGEQSKTTKAQPAPKTTQTASATADAAAAAPTQLTKPEQAATKLLQKVQALEAEYHNFSGNGDGTDPQEDGKSYETIDGKRRAFNAIRNERNKARADLNFLPGFTEAEIKTLIANPQAGLEIIQARVSARGGQAATTETVAKQAANTPATTEVTQGDGNGIRLAETPAGDSRVQNEVSGVGQVRIGTLENRGVGRDGTSTVGVSTTVGQQGSPANGRRNAGGGSGAGVTQNNIFETYQNGILSGYNKFAGTTEKLRQQAYNNAKSLIGIDEDIPHKMVSFGNTISIARFERGVGIELNSDKPSPNESLLTQIMVEEVLHAVDIADGISAAHLSGAFSSVSNIRREAAQHWKSGGEFGEFLAYGLDFTKKEWAWTEETRAAELFANLGVAYFSNTEGFAKALPIAHAFMANTFNRSSEQSSGQDANSGRGQGDTSVRPGQRVLGGDVQGDSGWTRQPRLVEIRQRILGGSPSGVRATRASRVDLGLNPKQATPKPAIGHQDPQAPAVNLRSLGTDYVTGDTLANLVTQDKRVTFAQKKLLKILAALMTDVKVVSVDPTHPLLNTRAQQADASYSPTERTIYTANDLSTPVTVIIHEMVHAAVDRVMHTDPSKLTKRQLAARHNIEDAYKFMQNKAELSGTYGMSDIHEFVAEAMSNPEFQELLAEYKVEKGNFLTQFFDNVKALLGFDAVGKSVLDVVYESTPFMFDAPTARSGETLNAPPRGAPMYDKFSKYGEAQKKRAGTKTTQSLGRRLELWGEENFIDHGARGESQILDEMEATNSPELKTALRNVQQDITLRDMMGESARLAKLVIDPVEANIRRLAKETKIDPNDLRHEAGLLAVAQHSLHESEKEAQKLADAVDKTQEIVDNHEALKSIVTAHEEEYRKLNRRLEDFHDGRTRGHREISQATLTEIKDDASSLLAKFITDMSHVEFKASPRGEARTMIAKALTDHVYSAKSSIGATKILEGIKLFMRDMETMIDPKDKAKHAHQTAVENLALWNEAQTNPRVAAEDGTGRLITANGLKLPGGYLMSEAKEIIAAADDTRHSAAGEIRSGFKALTTEAVKAGILTQQEADTYAAEFPYYVNTQGQSDAEKDDNFLERNLKGYMAPAEGSNHMGNSNDVFSNLIIRNDALAKNISNQKLGTSLAAAIKAGSGLFEYGIPYTGSSHAEKARTYVRVQDGAKVRYITPTTDAGQKMLGLHPNRRAYGGLNRVAKITSNYGRLVTFFAPAHGPITLIRDIPTRIFNLVGRKKDLIAEDGRMLNVYKVRSGVAAQAMNPWTVIEAARYALTGNMGESMAEFKTTGGYQTFVDRITSEDQVDRRFASGYKTWAGNSWDGLNNVVRRWNNIFETWSTLAAYKGMRSVGMSPKQSGYVTLSQMNFRKTGEITGRYMRPLYMFANATAQDLGETRKALFHRGKVNWQGVIEMSALAAAGSMLYSLARSEDDDDELGGKKMDALSSGDVYKNILISKGNGEYWRIPVAFGAIQAMYQIGVATNRSEAGLITPAEAMQDAFAGVVKIGSLTGGSETPFLDKPAIWAAQMVSPSLLRPITNTALGVNFAGSPVTTTLQADKFKSEQGKFNTPEAYKTFVKSVRETMGADFSPEDAKNLAEGFLIGPVKVALDEYIDVTGDKEMKGLDKETDTSTLMRILAANRFMSVTDEGRIAQTAFYKLTREARELEKQFNVTAPKKFDGKSENRQQKMARYASAGMTPEQAELLDAYKAYEKTHDPLKKQIRGVQEEALQDDRSDILKSLAAQEAAMMTDFVKTVKGAR